MRRGLLEFEGAAGDPPAGEVAAALAAGAAVGADDIVIGGSLPSGDVRGAPKLILC